VSFEDELEKVKKRTEVDDLTNREIKKDGESYSVVRSARLGDTCYAVYVETPEQVQSAVLDLLSKIDGPDVSSLHIFTECGLCHSQLDYGILIHGFDNHKHVYCKQCRGLDWGFEVEELELEEETLRVSDDLLSEIKRNFDVYDSEWSRDDFLYELSDSDFELMRRIDYVLENQHGEEEHGRLVWAGLMIATNIENPNSHPEIPDEDEFGVEERATEGLTFDFSTDFIDPSDFMERPVYGEAGHELDSNYLRARVEKLVNKKRKDYSGHLFVQIPKSFFDDWKFKVIQVKEVKYSFKTDLIDLVESKHDV
jgi:hypothetical protein